MLKLPLQNELGNALRAARKSASLTQGALSAKADISVPTLRLLERGQGNLTSLFRVLDVLDLEIRGRNLPPGESLGAQIAALRKRRGLGQRELAALIDTTQPTLVSLERQGRGRVAVLNAALVALGAGTTLERRGSETSFYAQAGNTSVFHGWETPKELLRLLYKVFGTFDLDPCSPTANKRRAPVRARVHFTNEDDGLSLPWSGKVFVNPPYGRELSHWVKKGKSEVEQGSADTVLALVPARTDTAWWHDHVAGQADVFFLRGRLSFGKGGQSAPFPSALCVWGASETAIEGIKEAFPSASHLPGNRISPSGGL